MVCGNNGIKWSDVKWNNGYPSVSLLSMYVSRINYHVISFLKYLISMSFLGGYYGIILLQDS
jgi:hypothetical protein